MCHTSATPWHLAILAGIVAILMALTAAFYPGAGSLRLATGGETLSALAWILAQSVLVMLPGLTVGLLIVKYWPRLALRLGSTWYFGIYLIVVCDSVTYHWIAERLISRKMLAIAIEIPQSLAPHVPASTWLYLFGLGLSFLAGSLATLRISGAIANRITRRLSIPWLLAGLLIATAGLAAPALWNPRTGRAAMHDHSARFPLCALRLYQSPIARPDLPHAEETPTSRASLDALVQNFQRRRETVSITQMTGELPDVLLVIIESMRSELIDQRTMPNLWRYAQKGIHCRYHFSAGNATNHGMFSILQGIDATFYGHFNHQKPLLNHLFGKAGYEIGFFAGHNDWQNFRMDGFIHADHFDRFQVDPPDWLATDQRAAERTRAFLDDRTNTRPPRLAVLYLYSTHADYHSYPKDQIFQPAADDRFLIPFSADAKPAIWNRYKNSAHSVDRFLSAVLQDDRVIIVTGDHGESFLEDGVCGHGTRISKYQNMTPALIYVPGGVPRTIDSPTSHADLLPTLLSAANIDVSDASIFDGDDLNQIGNERIENRVISTRDYLSNECGLITNSFSKHVDVFAVRVELPTQNRSARLLGAIDAKGNPTQTTNRLGAQVLSTWQAGHTIQGPSATNKKIGPSQ
ncbi:sulfatase-like hydrolase/transferase [Stieleria marina]|uniref:Sulfatase n=1 Tax=Stieleria marina TaxID=1930275 RepID=A0A517P2P0_9BACT|nr:Sulfatase [Planctomycetes bacterium K23_9]